MVNRGIIVLVENFIMIELCLKMAFLLEKIIQNLNMIKLILMNLQILFRFLAHLTFRPCTFIFMLNI